MSRANPTALRIASKTQSTMFIGVSRYYFYDHLKQNLNILKLTNQISKQIVLPTNDLLRSKTNYGNPTVLTPHLLPINTAFAAKQLFSTKYRLNKRRFSAATLHYICWLKDDFNKNYRRFNTGTGFINYGKPYKVENFSKKKVHPRNVDDSRQGTVKTNYTQFSNITKANQISDIYKYFVFKRAEVYSNPVVSYKVKPNKYFLNCLAYLSSSALKRGSQPFYGKNFQSSSVTTKEASLGQPTDKKEGPLFYTKLLYMQNFKKMQIAMENYLSNLPLNSNALKSNSRPLLLQKQKLPKIDVSSSFRPNYKDISNNMLLLAFLNLLYSQNKKIRTCLLAKQVSLTNQLSARQQKTLLTREKSGQSLNMSDYVDSTLQRDSPTKYNYLLSAYPGFKTSNYSSFSKIQKHINLFSNTSRPIMPLELLIYRSFWEPAGLNYFTALDNRLSKSRFSCQFSRALFKRVSNNGFIPNYTNTQTGLIRLKAQIIFEFLYNVSNQSEAVTEPVSFLKNHRRMLSSSTGKLWIRKGSTIRL